VLNADESSLIAMELDMNPIVDSQAALDLYPRAQPEDMSIFPSKPPIVTIMGHVDHGKTTLLDTLRKSSVAAGEAGGITQHIGAFSVDLPSKKRITFLDTPGHAAFSAMRSRGANVTDIVVLVVAADDGVMPQTIEAIKHAQSANVPIIVAINKCDKHGADPSRVKQELLQHEIQLEEFGGDVASVEVSGLTGKGLDELEENIITLAEVLDLRAERSNTAEGVVLESNIEKGRGNVATILVRSGTLKTGGHIVAGNTMCKVRSMTDDKGKTVKEALPGQPVKVIGWKELPSAGDEMLQAPTESVAKTVVANRIAKEQRKQQLQDLEVINEKRRRQREQVEAERNVERQYKKDMWMFHQGLITQYPETLNKRLSAINGLTNSQDEEEDKVKEFRAIVKGDVSGTVEAVVDCLNGLQTPEVRVKVVSSGVGNISESDVQLAAASEGHIIGFNVKADKRIQQEASMNNVSIKSYNIIYKLLDDVKSSLCDMLPPIITTQVNGEATIQQVFQITVKGRETKPIAGCRITNGTVSRNGRVRVVRNRETVWEGMSLLYSFVH
jgi:translation initiation factor IF-2